MEVYNKEFFGKPPSWTTSWGIYFVTAFFVIVLLSSFFISYNEILVGKIEVTSTSPTVLIKARKGGELVELFHSIGDTLNKGEPIAVLGSSALFKDVQIVKQQINYIGQQDSVLEQFSFPNLKLGPIQPFFGNYIRSYQSLLSFQLLKKREKQNLFLTQQLVSKKGNLSIINNRIELSNNNKKLVDINYKRNKILFQRGVISKQELETIQMMLFNESQSNSKIKEQRATLLFDITQAESLLYSNDYTDVEEFKNLVSNLENTRQELFGEIYMWEHLNVLSSPINGTLSILDIWNPFQEVKKGEEIFSVSPDDIGSLIGKISLPIHKSGKVKIGQTVIVKLLNYPYEEWGSLQGKISFVSDVPKMKKELNYTIFIDIKDLTTSFGKEIDLARGLHGKAEIILEESSLFHRFIVDFRKTFSR